MLTQQQHYDWGLRALKTCLALAGKLLRESRSAAPGQQIADSVQTQLIVRSVWLATMPKLTFDDTSRQVSISYGVQRGCVLWFYAWTRFLRFSHLVFLQALQ